MVDGPRAQTDLTFLKIGFACSRWVCMGCKRWRGGLGPSCFKLLSVEGSGLDIRCQGCRVFLPAEQDQPSPDGRGAGSFGYVALNQRGRGRRCHREWANQLLWARARHTA